MSDTPNKTTFRFSSLPLRPKKARKSMIANVTIVAMLRWSLSDVMRGMVDIAYSGQSWLGVANSHELKNDR